MSNFKSHSATIINKITPGSSWIFFQNTLHSQIPVMSRNQQLCVLWSTNPQVLYRSYAGCVWKKLYNFYFLIVKKVNNAQQQHSNGQKHDFPVCKKIFKWYQSMVNCKSYGPLSDKW